jgi:hypothetical protein
VCRECTAFLLVDGGDLQRARSDALDELNAAAVCRYERDFLGAIIAHDEAVYALYQKRQRELLRGNFKPAGVPIFFLSAAIRCGSHKSALPLDRLLRPSANGLPALVVRYARVRISHARS